MSVDLRKKKKPGMDKGYPYVTGVRGKKIGEIRERWGKEMWRKEGRKEGTGKKRGVGF